MSARRPSARKRKPTRRALLVLTIVVVLPAIVAFRLTRGPVSGLAGKRAGRDRADLPALQVPAADLGEKALTEVRDIVAIGPRVAGSEGAAAAARMIASRLESHGLVPATDTFTNATPDGDLVFRNVVAEVRGEQDRLLVLVTHYDTKGGISDDFTGANDSGSSTGLLLELARRFSSMPAGWPTLLLAFVDGEECRKAYGRADGLHGSRRLAESLVVDGRAPRVAAVIVLDMIGDRDLSVTLPRNSTPWLVSMVFDAAHAEGARQAFALSGTSILDDHVPFLQRNMPAVDIIDFQYGSRPGLNDYWHTPEDSLDKISAASLETVGNVVLRVLNRLRAEEITPRSGAGAGRSARRTR